MSPWRRLNTVLRFVFLIPGLVMMTLGTILLLSSLATFVNAEAGDTFPIQSALLGVFLLVLPVAIFSSVKAAWIYRQRLRAEREAELPTGLMTYVLLSGGTLLVAAVALLVFFMFR